MHIGHGAFTGAFLLLAGAAPLHAASPASLDAYYRRSAGPGGTATRRR